MPSPDPHAPRRGGATGAALEAVPGASPSARPTASRGHSAIGLARLSHRRLFAPVGDDLYRHIARLVELDEDREFLVVPSGTGALAKFLAEHSGAAGSGVEPDAELVAAAMARARESGLSDRLHYEHASLEDLPYQDEVFDVVLGEAALGSAADPEAAIRELVRTAKPMASVVLLQLIWTGNADAGRREALVESLGVRPLLAVEWKQLLREAGVVDLYVEDWSDSAVSPRQPWILGALAGFGPLRERIAMAVRAWRLWGWRGMRQALAFRDEIRDLVVDEKILGLSLIKGTKWPDARPTRT